MIDSPPLCIASYSKIIRTNGEKNHIPTTQAKKKNLRDVKFSAQMLYRDRPPHDIPIPTDTTGAEGRRIHPGTSVPCIAEASLSPEKKRIKLEKQYRKVLGNAESKAKVFTLPAMQQRGFLFLRAMKKQHVHWNPTRDRCHQLNHNFITRIMIP